MQRTTASLWLALALGLLGIACAKDSASPTDPSVAAGAAASKGRGEDWDDDRDDDDRPVTYAIIGDVPYGSSAVAKFPTLIGALNADPEVSLTVHLGDIKSGSTVCSDASFQGIATAFSTFADPLVYAIGDNEWTDCHRANNGGYNPLERLASVRELFFATPGVTLGAQQRVKAQRGYPENVRWEAAGAVFATFHVIGSNNGLAPWFGDRAAPNTGETAAETASREAEVAARNTANIKWLELVFEEAQEERAKGVVLMYQADLWHPEDRAAGAIFSAHQAWVARLSQLATTYGKPVLLLSGDSHDYRVDAGVPWMSVYYGVPSPANVTQVIVDRSIEDDIDYLRLRVDPKSATVFAWEQVFVP